MAALTLRADSASADPGLAALTARVCLVPFVPPLELPAPGPA